MLKIIICWLKDKSGKNAVTNEVSQAPIPKKNKINAGDNISDTRKPTPIKNQIKYILMIDYLNIYK